MPRSSSGGRADAPRLLGQLDSLGRTLYPYQIEGVERFITHGRLLLADDMGLGKTTQAIAACHVLHRSKKVRRGLLIVPAALKPQWVREWQATTDIAVTSVEGSPESRTRVYRQPKTPFLVIGYEQLLKISRSFTNFRRTWLCWTRRNASRTMRRRQRST